MKTRKLFFGFLISMIGITLFVISCKKDDIDKDTETVSDNAFAFKTFNDLSTISDQAASGGLQTFADFNAIGSLLGGCATISHDTTSIPHKLIIDFGDSNCLCRDFRYRRGKIIVSYTGRYRDSGTVIVYSFDNYFVTDCQITNNSSRTVTNKGRNSSGHLWYIISENGSIIKANNGGTITWISTRTREWIAGSTTLQSADDVYLISGTASGTSANGQNFNLASVTPVRIELNCHNIVSGIVEINIAGKATRKLDYGNGTCDNQATVTILNRTYTITLR
jgi:hypothetical protein